MGRKQYIVKSKGKKGVFCIGLVLEPATENDFIMLSKDKQVVKLKAIDAEKRELIGVVLEPNKPIYRNQNGEEFDIIFPDEVVKDLMIGFVSNGYQNNANIEHQNELKLDGVTFFENWIVEDEKNDKSNIYELGAKKGSWVAKMKADELTWDCFIKTGFVRGFSIEAIVDLEEIKLNSNMNKVELNDETKNWFESLLSKFSNSKTELAEEKVAEEVELEDDKEEEKEKEEVKMMDDAMKAEIMDMIQSVVAEAMKAMKGDMEVEMSKVKKENDDLKVELKRIGSQPSAKAKKSQPTTKSVGSESMIEFLNRVTQ